MAHRELGQLDLADGLIGRKLGANETLERISALLDWPSIERLLAVLHAKVRGAPSYPPLMMVKALLLAQWHGLSDGRLEDALADRLSFRRFVGISLGDASPDEVTIWRFRQDLQRAGLAEKLFTEINRQIAERGLILRRGTLVDATLVDAQVRRPPLRKSPPAPPDAPPGTTTIKPPSKLERSARDPDAAWTRKRGKLHFGYKGHVGVDQSSGIIRTAEFTPANVNETTVADKLMSGDEAALYGDAAYDTKARRARLRRNGVTDGLMHRANKHHPLSAEQTEHNRMLNRTRCAVERVFAVLKRHYGWRRVRYLGLARNAAHFLLLCTAINLRRLAVLAT